MTTHQAHRQSHVEIHDDSSRCSLAGVDPITRFVTSIAPMSRFVMSDALPASLYLLYVLSAAASGSRLQAFSGAVSPPHPVRARETKPRIRGFMRALKGDTLGDW